MALNEVISTSGDLRRLLSQTMVDIKNGNLSVDKGMTIAALSKEITSSLQAEVNVAKVRIAMLSAGKTIGEVTTIGKLLIDDNSPQMLSGK